MERFTPVSSISSDDLDAPIDRYPALAGEELLNRGVLESIFSQQCRPQQLIWPPLKRTWPWLIKITRRQDGRVHPQTVFDNNGGRPLFFMNLIDKINNILTDLGSRLASGSSKRRIGLSSIRTLAKLTRCFYPPDKSVADDPRASSNPSVLPNSAHALSSFPDPPCHFQEQKESSATLKPINWPSVSCKTVLTKWDFS